jgi:ABC-type multidrug transport system permease subunit
VFFSVSEMPAWLKPVADHLPLTYLADATRAVITHGLGPAGIGKDLIAMSLWAVLLIGLATMTFRFGAREPA